MTFGLREWKIPFPFSGTGMRVANSIPDFRDGNWRPVFPGIPGIGNSRSWLTFKQRGQVGRNWDKLVVVSCVGQKLLAGNLLFLICWQKTKDKRQKTKKDKWHRHKKIKKTKGSI